MEVSVRSCRTPPELLPPFFAGADHYLESVQPHGELPSGGGTASCSSAIRVPARTFKPELQRRRLSAGSPLERAILALIEPHLVGSEAELLEKNTFKMTFQEFDWRLNDLSTRSQ